MYYDFKDLLSAFYSHGVKYLILGGCAGSCPGSRVSPETAREAIATARRFVERVATLIDVS
jgi:hypothetical protein